MDAAVFKCEICKDVFYTKRYLTRHVKRVHSKTTDDANTSTFTNNVQCCEENCNEKFRCLQDLRDHLESCHDFEDINSCQKLTFPSESEFIRWLADEEREAASKYNIRKKEKCRDHTYTIFHCNRSGVFKSKAKLHEKQLKAQGSAKIGHHCTSSIIKKEFSSHTEVLYFPEHYNHEKELKHIPIAKEDKQIIAGKLLEGVEEKRILRDIRKKSQRSNLISNKDIQNVKRDFGIDLPSKGSVISDDEFSVHSWVQEMEKTEMNPVLFYKRQDDDDSDIAKEDFMLIIMTEFQKNMLMRYGADRICVDSTHGISGYQFELVTILVIDEYEEGVPAAFCILSSVNTVNLIHFFKCIKLAVSRNLCTNIFMSDDAAMFKNAWVDVFGPCLKFLLCAWHVDRAWQNHVKSLPKEIQGEVYKTLKSLMYELDEKIFNTMLTNFCEMLKEDPNTYDFYSYFMKHYVQRCEMWAYCFRKGAKINTNMHIENFHKILKHIYLQGKQTKRVDKVINELINLVTDKNYDQFIKSVKGKITKRCTQNFKRHRVAKNLNLEIEETEADNWKVFSGKNIYRVSKVHSCSASCVITCRSCAVCSTAYTCNCHDNQISNFVCKHIHSVIISLNKEQNYIGPLYNSDDTNIIKNTLGEKTQLNYHEKNKIKISTLSTKLNMLSNMDDNVSLQIRNHLNAIENLMQVKSERILPVISKNTEPSNKRILKQRRFHSVKKSNSSKKN